jgi:hypothetical protein
MADENTTPPTDPAQAPATPPEKPVTPPENTAEPAPTPEAPVPAAPKTVNFSDKMALVKKKAEYINGKNMDPVAAEEQARKDLNLPPMTEADKTGASGKNVFEKILDFFGLNQKLTAKPETQKVPEAELKDPEPAPTSEQPVQSTEAATAAPVAPPAAAPTNPTPVVPTATEGEIEKPQQPQA